MSHHGLCRTAWLPGVALLLAFFVSCSPGESSTGEQTADEARHGGDASASSARPHEASGNDSANTPADDLSGAIPTSCEISGHSTSTDSTAVASHEPTAMSGESSGTSPTNSTVTDSAGQTVGSDAPDTNEPTSSDVTSGAGTSNPDESIIPLIDPYDCELTPLDAPISEDQCIFQAKCGSRQAGVNCTDVGFGSWLCSCMEFSTLSGFELTNVDIDTACRAAAPLCTWGIHPSQVEPPECEAAVNSTTNYPCERTMRCTQKVHIGEGFIATTSEDLYSRCIVDPEGGFQCNCRSESTGYVYSVEGADAAVGCEAGTQLCDPYQRVDLGSASCEVNTESLHADDCAWQHDCTYAVSVAAASIEVYDSPRANCRVYEGSDAPSCECSVLGRQLSFTLTEPTLDLATCTNAVDLCAGTAEPVATQGVECIETSRLIEPGTCSYRADCSQAGVIDDVPIVTRHPLWSDCFELPLEPGTWRCSCDLGHAVAMTEFSGPPPDDICLTYAANCTNVDLFEAIDE